MSARVMSARVMSTHYEARAARARIMKPIMKPMPRLVMKPRYVPHNFFITLAHNSRLRHEPHNQTHNDAHNSRLRHEPHNQTHNDAPNVASVMNRS